MKRIGVAAALVAIAASALTASARQTAPVVSRPSASAPPAERTVPFPVGESLTYDVSWSSYLTAGTAVTTVKEKKASGGSTAYYIVAEGRTTPLLQALYTLYYKLETWLDGSTLLPQHAASYSEEGRRRRQRTTTFDRAARRAHYSIQTATVVNADVIIAPDEQDALSAIYALRAAPLQQGRRVSMPVTDDGTTYRVQFEVGALERVRVPLGDMSAWKIAATLVDAGGHPVGRNLAIWIADNERRWPVKLQAELAVGSFALALRAATN
jgi:hypothetical protein